MAKQEHKKGVILCEGIEMQGKPIHWPCIVEGEVDVEAFA